MKRRQTAEPLSAVPEHLQQIDMSRYVDVIEESLRERPGDTFHAGLVAWRVWCRERSAWREQHGLSWAEGQKVMGTTTGPREMWICDRYGIPFRPRFSDGPDSAA